MKPNVMKLFLSYLETLIKLWEAGKLDSDDFAREVRQAVSEEREIDGCDAVKDADRFFKRVEKLLKK